MVPEAAFVGFTVPIDQVTLWFEALITIAVNCCCWPALKLSVCGLTVTVSEPPPKIFFMQTASYDVIWLMEFRRVLFRSHTKYMPLEKLEMLLVSNTAL